MQPFKEKMYMPALPVKIFFARDNESSIISSHPHWHNEVEILYILEGFANQQLDGNTFMVKNGDIVIIWNNQLHSTYSLGKEKCTILILQFSLEGIVDTGKMSLMNSLYNQVCFTNCINVKSNIGKQTHELLTEIDGELGERKIGYELAIRAKIFELYINIIRNLDNLPISKLDPLTYEKAIINDIFGYIDSNYSQEITLKMAAKITNLSVTHFLRVFKRVTGQTFLQYLNMYRINMAQTMLYSDESVTGTALECGFDNVNTFIRNFKKYRQCTPSNYKKYNTKPNLV